MQILTGDLSICNKHYSSRLKEYRIKQPKNRLFSIFKEIIVPPCYIRLVYVRMRVINCICMILHNPRILYIATERTHMNGRDDRKDDGRETEDANVGSETCNRKHHRKRFLFNERKGKEKK